MLKLPLLFAPATARAAAALTGTSLSFSGAGAAPEVGKPGPVRPAATSFSLLQTLPASSRPATAELDASDEAFTRAVRHLEQSRTAQTQAERRAARGEISQLSLQTFTDATRAAEQLVERLQQLRVASWQRPTGVIFVAGMPASKAVGALRTTVAAPKIAPPRLAHATEPLPVMNVRVSVSSTPKPTALEATSVVITPEDDTLASGARPMTERPVIAALPVLTQTLAFPRDGSISPPAFGSRITLNVPHKAGARRAVPSVVSVPASRLAQAAPTAVAAPVVAVAATPTSTPAPVQTVSLPTAVAPVPSAPSTGTVPAKLAPPAVKVVKTVPVVTPGPAPAVVKKNALTRLAQLEAQLGRAERRLNAAESALGEGQRQLSKFASTLREAMLEAGPDATGLHPFVKVSEKYAGTPYVWGGESRRGFDCSGLIILVMRELGYKTLPHSAAEQFKYGTPIAQPLLKPGDLVFFANTYKPGISHVGIYLGKRRFIHAAGTGKGTIVSSLDDGKYQAKYAGARRLIAAR